VGAKSSIPSASKPPAAALVAERIAGHAHHRFGAKERFGRVDIDPAAVADVASEEFASRRQRTNAVGQRAIAGPFFEPFELADELGTMRKTPVSMQS